MIQSREPADHMPIRVLVVGMTNRAGGIESFLMEYCERLVGEGFHFDFLSRFPDCSYAERIAKMGGKIYAVTRRSKNPVRFYREIRAFFEQHADEYDAIWDNECMMNDITPLLYAKRYGIARRIYHSHCSDSADWSLKGRIQRALHQYHRMSIQRIATDFWACSELAADWAFPRSVREKRLLRIIPNAISVSQFQYDPLVRQQYREQLGLSQSFVVGNVGHLCTVKNQSFLLSAFSLFYHKHADAVLLLVGDGKDRDMLASKAKELGIEQAVRFLGSRPDVANLLQAMDLYAMPSRFEGLGIAAVEAQVSGLPCILSDTLPKNVQFRKNVMFLSIDQAEPWSDEMECISGMGKPRTDGSADAKAAGYDIQIEAERLAVFWRSMGNT